MADEQSHHSQAGGPGFDAPAGAVPTDLDSAVDDLRMEIILDEMRRSRSALEAIRSEVDVARSLVAAVGNVVQVSLNSGETVSGEVVEVGRDYGCLKTTGGAVWISLTAVMAIRSAIDTSRMTAQATALMSGLVDVLEDFMFNESVIVVSLLNGERIAGTVLAAGQVLSMRTGTDFAVVPISGVETLATKGFSGR